jgi:hypothetical protein
MRAVDQSAPRRRSPALGRPPRLMALRKSAEELIPLPKHDWNFNFDALKLPNQRELAKTPLTQVAELHVFSNFGLGVLA